MTRLVALFRGINVGGRNKIAMSELRAAFESRGCDNVSSVIQSGNICFDSGDPAESVAAMIRETVAARFDVDVPIVLRTADAFEAALSSVPWKVGSVEPKLHHIMFLADTAPADATDLLGVHTPGTEYLVLGSEIHVRYPQGSARSTFTVNLVDRRLSTVATARNLPTCEKIAASLRRT
jgi:uncharacterized protein (DUF1697 family)